MRGRFTGFAPTVTGLAPKPRYLRARLARAMRGRVNPLGRGGAVAACVLTLALLAVGLNGTPPVRAQDPGGVVKVATSYPSWTNGAVVLAFPHSHPTFSLTSVAN